MLDPTICAWYGREVTHKHQRITEREKKRVKSSENVQFEMVQEVFSRVNPSLRLEDGSALRQGHLKTEITYQSEEEMKVRISLGCKHDHVNDLFPVSR